MKAYASSDFFPRLHSSYYWKRKEKFKFYEDTYTEWIVIAVEDGSFYYELDGKSGTATLGDLFICPPHLTFRRVVVTPLTFFFLRLSWEWILPSEPTADELRELPNGIISIRDTARLTADYAVMKQAEALDHDRKIRIQNHYLRDIWLKYSCESGEESWMADLEQTAGRNADPLMEKAALLIQKYAFQKLDLKQIASELNLSPVRLTQKFKGDFGVTPIHYLTSLRLKKATTLLTETNLTLEQIAESIGYQNGFYLNRVFKNQMKMTPAKFREMNRV
ncbi:helix-turn-helix domain-containing protein [Paenibacillus allorhizosphaerae]|uniref:HTH-type transcriptional activator RhaR n=1 Tax=Paenibacillus allorhizosphaerae TaxID=2849866 RepID=A0ABM8VGU4_9BACL|nr:AraC family transcriptional regulator [Paenibacillus allorhizosphaerae]CAG7637871.1 HTH-type transcriptional activator RhaR [Paenibacillus allorhizosphaerae]